LEDHHKAIELEGSSSMVSSSVAGAFPPVAEVTAQSEDAATGTGAPSPLELPSID
jgi:hypothetical protein